MEQLNFRFKDFLLYGNIGSIILGKKKEDVEAILWTFDYYERVHVGFLGYYNDEKPELQFYFNDEGILYNFHLRHDNFYRKLPGFSNTQYFIRQLFSDYSLFLSEPELILETIIDSNIDVFYVDKLSGEFSNYYFVTSNNVKLFFEFSLVKLRIKAGLCYIGCSSDLIESTASYDSIKVEKKEVRKILSQIRGNIGNGG